MSKFEDNPFGEPMVDNPFADPVAQQQRPIPNTIVGAAILDEYNPFDDDNSSRVNAQYTSGASNPTQPTPQLPPYNQSASTQSSAYGTASPPQISTAEFQRRQEELDRKAADLERREAELRNSSSSDRRNNWPPLPEKYCPQPCFYQDIEVEIPSEFQKIVRQLYYLWMFYAAIMVVNIFGSMLLMFHANAFTQFGLSIIYAVMFTPASFLCWYRPAYKAFRSDSSFNFMVFFFIFFFQMFMLIIQTIGISGSGYCGFITALTTFDGTPFGIVIGIFLLIIAFSFALCTTGNVLLLTKVHAIYRSSDSMSMTKASAEFSTGFIQNQHVQRAAAGAATSAVSSQFSNASAANSANRY